ncbi:hypothetical protein [Exiguobacterium sp. USCH10]|uniref:hypothetical protein n=1 Tax=Exiguobacterium sp. USCH10 TaxID=3024839 RepID=UPI0030A18CA1
MIPTLLQDAIIDRLKGMFEGELFKKTLPDGTVTTGPMMIFSQGLPARQHEDDIQFPFVIVKLMQARHEKPETQPRVRIGFIVGLYDDAPDNQGYRDMVRIINRIIEEFRARPLAGRFYELSYPLDASPYEEETAPQWLGSIDTYWEAPIPARKDVEELI